MTYFDRSSECIAFREDSFEGQTFSLNADFHFCAVHEFTVDYSADKAKFAS